MDKEFRAFYHLPSLLQGQAALETYSGEVNVLR